MDRNINTLKRFRIMGLHGRKNFDVVIKGSTLVLVGENGSGKTTFLRILFYFLSGHWLSLVQFRFDSIVATIGDTEYTVSHERLAKAFKKTDLRLLSELPPPHRRRITGLLERGDFERVSVELERIGGRFSIPPEIFFRHSQMDLLDSPPRGPLKDLHETIIKIRDEINAQVLYLPTYRRIERELWELNNNFEDIESDSIRRHRNRFSQNESGETYIELVEFGMRDVQKAVDRTLEKLKEFAREGLNNLTLNYLGDIVNQEYQNAMVEEIADISDETVGSVLDRIHESILTKNHKAQLITLINRARSANEPNEHERIICHYFMKLLGFQQSLQENENQIVNFCDLCSEYIVDKRFVYNSQTFSFSIIPTDELDTDRSIKLSDLSSGEKQIVSLFSHLYLSGQKSFFVLIDEPELSLSVPWQRRFLQDIRKGKFCKGLVAVTHSPFIYDNELRDYTHSLGEFVSF